VITIHIDRRLALAAYEIWGSMAKKKYVVVGTGAIGTLVADQLAAAGHSVIAISRHAEPSANLRIKHIAGDASDASFLADQATGAAAIFNCVNPPYHRWPQEWPPIATALLHAAETSGAVLTTLSNLYAYGVPDGSLTPETPLRATYAKGRVRGQMWLDAKAAHDAKRIRATEVRASDFIGPTGFSVINRVVPDIVAGKGVQLLGNPDAPHSWTYTVDVAMTLIAAAQHKGAWGRAWHVPTNPPRTQRQAVKDLADAAGVRPPKVSAVPNLLLRMLGAFNPQMREVLITMYQFEHPFVIDDAATRKELGITPTPWNKVLRATVDQEKRGTK
jgi:nucleoside-diphosphate-sugar epimerase